jgi:hypothetical protein
LWGRFPLGSPLFALFTEEYPQFSYEFLTGASRWQHRVYAHQFGLTGEYPPFRMDH